MYWAFIRLSAEKSSRSAGLPRSRAVLDELKASRDIGLERLTLRGAPCQEVLLGGRLPIRPAELLLLLETCEPKRFLYEDCKR